MRWRDLKKQTRIWGQKETSLIKPSLIIVFCWENGESPFYFSMSNLSALLIMKINEKIYLEQGLCNTGSSTVGPSIRASLWWSLPSLLDPHLPPWACLAPPLLGSCQKSLWTSDSAYWFASIAQFLWCTTCSGREKSLDFGVFFSWSVLGCYLNASFYWNDM